MREFLFGSRTYMLFDSSPHRIEEPPFEPSAEILTFHALDIEVAWRKVKELCVSLRFEEDEKSVHGSTDDDEIVCAGGDLKSFFDVPLYIW